MYCIVIWDCTYYSIKKLGWYTNMAYHLFFWNFKPWCRGMFVFFLNQINITGAPSFSLVISTGRKPFEYKPSLKKTLINKIYWALILWVVEFVKITIKDKWHEQKGSCSTPGSTHFTEWSWFSQKHREPQFLHLSDEAICISADIVGFWPIKDFTGASLHVVS